MADDKFQILAATTNIGKIRELEKLLADLPLTLRNLKEFSGAAEVEETGATFAENAVLKAQAYAKQCGMPTLADDSGLEVEALGGAPGVFSARYAGKDADYEKKIGFLLKNLGQESERRARFVCVLAIADETGEIKFTAEGVCPGKIALNSRGTNGFGYDPVFIPDGFTQTFGELPEKIKRKISHRAQASEKIIRYLRDFYGVSVD